MDAQRQLLVAGAVRGRARRSESVDPSHSQNVGDDTAELDVGPFKHLLDAIRLGS